MAHSSSCRLVIDASVARAAGGQNSPDSGSQECRAFLRAVLDICHQVVWSPAISAEWQRHRSSYSSTWLRQMFARKKVVKIDVPADADLREAIDGATMSPARCRAMEKDCHLLEAAWAADQVVASLDETVRGCYSELALSFGRLRLLVWINPQQDEDEPQGCLDGDPRARGRRLGT